MPERPCDPYSVSGSAPFSSDLAPDVADAPYSALRRDLASLGFACWTLAGLSPLFDTSLNPASPFPRYPVDSPSFLRAMAFRAIRRSVVVARGQNTTGLAKQRLAFHSSRRALVQVGDQIPNLAVLVENSPGNKVNLADEFKKGDGLIIGVPGAFSGACSQQHVPSFMSHPSIKDAGQVFVVSVNDAFV